MLEDTFGWDRPEIRDAARRRGQADRMARTPLAAAVVVTAVVTAVLVDSASAAAASTTVPHNRGWITGAGTERDQDPGAGD
jgi:hypothetical protein